MKKPDQDCPIAQLFEVLWKKRVIFIIRTIAEGEQTFTGIKEKLGGLNSKILTDRLDELEEKWYIIRDVVTTKPIKIRYWLSKMWTELSKQLLLLADRANVNIKK